VELLYVLGAARIIGDEFHVFANQVVLLLARELPTLKQPVNLSELPL
jgi:hypothetical protein